MHYLFHIILAFLSGAAMVTSLWAISLHRYAMRHAYWNEAARHGGIAIKAAIGALLLMGILWAIPAKCQPVDPRLGKWHDLPPPMNIVNAGFLLEHSATTRRDATYVALAGLAAGAVLYSHNPTVGLAVGGFAIGYSIHLNLRSAGSTRRAAQLLQIGYRAEYLYDVVPDSIDAHPHLRIIFR